MDSAKIQNQDAQDRRHFTRTKQPKQKRFRIFKKSKIQKEERVLRFQELRLADRQFARGDFAAGLPPVVGNPWQIHYLASAFRKARAREWTFGMGFAFAYPVERNQTGLPSRSARRDARFDERPPRMSVAMNALSLRKIAFGLCLVAVSAQSVRAEVVFGNLGPTGAGVISDSGSDFGPNAGSLKILAQGFTTGSNADFLTLQSVDLGAFYDNFATENLTVGLYSNDGGNNPGTLLATSSPASVGVKGKYTFGFSNYELSATTNYWIVPQFDVDWFWYINDAESQPVGENSSGYEYLGTRRSNGTIAGTWSSSIQPYSLSVNAVPEPGTIGLAIAAICAGGVALARRRKSIAG